MYRREKAPIFAIPDLVVPVPAVIPEAPEALSGNFTGAGALYDPACAQRHCMPPRARDDANASSGHTLPVCWREFCFHPSSPDEERSS